MSFSGRKLAQGFVNERRPRRSHKLFSAASSTDGYFAQFNGTTGKLLKVRSPANALTDIGAIAASILTTRGDIITRDASGPIRRALGVAKTVLRSDGTDLLMAQLAMADISDYEEGSWTPALDFGGAAVGMTVSSATGRFIRMGKIVILGFDHRITAKGSSTGTAHITGLPYAAGLLNGHGMIGDFFNMATLGGGVLAGVVQAGTSSILLSTGSASGSSNLTNSNFTNTSIIAGTLVYSRAS